MQSTTPLNLNLQFPNYSTTMYAVQHDRLSRKITAVLADGSAPFAPEYGTLAVVRYKKPDGTCGFYDTDEDGNDAVSWEDNVATIMLAEQALTVAGTVLCQVQFYNGDDQRLSSFTWKIIVEETACPDSQITSSDYFNILTQQIASIMEVITDLPAPATDLPVMDGTAAIGIKGEFARADHVHPHDTDMLATATPIKDGTGAVGTSTKAAREDHVHPSSILVESITPSNVMTGYTVTVRKSGNVVLVIADRNSNPSLTSGWNTICNLPSGCRPYSRFDFIGINNATSDPSKMPEQFRMNTNGDLAVYSGSADSTRMPLCYATFVAG